MAKVEIPDNIIKIVWIFNDINRKWLVPFLWILTGVIVSIAAYGAVIKSEYVILQAGLLTPVAVLTVVGTKTIMYSRLTNINEFVRGLVVYTMWALSVVVLLTALPVVGYQSQLRLEDVGLVSTFDEAIIYDNASDIFEVFPIYLLVAYIVSGVGVWLKGDGTGQAN